MSKYHELNPTHSKEAHYHGKLKISELESTKDDDLTQNIQDIASEVKSREKSHKNSNTAKEPQTQSSSQQLKEADGRDQEQVENNNIEVGPSRMSSLEKDEDHSADNYLGASSLETKPSRRELPTINAKVQTFVKFVKNFNQATLITINSSSDQLKSRPMYIYNHINYFQFYLLSKKDSSLVSDIKEDSRVNLTFQQGDKSSNNWCSISANASIVHDLSIVEKLWGPSVRNWLKDLGDNINDGSMNDPRIEVILIESKEIDFFLENQASPFEKLKYAITQSQKPAKYESDTTSHLTSDDIDSYIKVYGLLK